MSEPTEQPPVESPTPAERAVAGAKLLGGSIGCLAVAAVAVIVALFIAAYVAVVFWESPVLWIGFILVMVAVSGGAAAKRRK